MHNYYATDRLTDLRTEKTQIYRHQDGWMDVWIDGWICEWMGGKVI